MFVGRFIGSPKMNFLDGQITGGTVKHTEVTLDAYPEIKLSLARARADERPAMSALASGLSISRPPAA